MDWLVEEGNKGKGMTKESTKQEEEEEEEEEEESERRHCTCFTFNELTVSTLPGKLRNSIVVQ
jgi:hypothetical protein